MTGAEALRAAIPRLEAAGVEGAPRDARRLLAHALGIAAGRLTLHIGDILSPDARQAFDKAIARRCSRQPVAQITGSREFYGRSFRVSAVTLDPRPETETLIEIARACPARRILDLGTGTGCILLTLLAEWAQATGIGTDLSEAALAVAATNADQLGVSARAEFLRADWFTGLGGTFDLITSNPPYISSDEMRSVAPELRDWEPHLALTDFSDGLSAYRVIAAASVGYLNPEGRVLVEIGARQGRDVVALFRNAGFSRVSVHTDLDRRDRVVLAQI